MFRKASLILFGILLSGQSNLTPCVRGRVSFLSFFLLLVHKYRVIFLLPAHIPDTQIVVGTMHARKNVREKHQLLLPPKIFGHGLLQVVFSLNNSQSTSEVSRFILTRHLAKKKLATMDLSYMI